MLTMNHELGHGYRMIEAGGSIIGIIYNMPPPFNNEFSYISLNYPEKFTKQQGLMINLGGSESNLIFSDLMRKNILLDQYVFKKYDMISTTLGRNQIRNRLFKGVNKKGKDVSNWDLNAFAPTGGVLSKVEDVAHFAQAHFENDPILSMQMKKTAKFSEQVDIGLGWFIFYDKERNAIYWHNGGTGGYSSDMSVSVESQKSVVILSNVFFHVKETGQYRDLNFTLLSLIE